MRWFLTTWFFLIWFWIGVGSGQAEVLLSSPQALGQMFPAATAFEKKEIYLTAEQRAVLLKKCEGAVFKEGVPYTAYIARTAERIVGYALEDVEPGKWGPIHFICGILPDGQIQAVLVLSFSENRGRPVAKKRFLKQFKGKTLSDPIQLRKDVDGVTGATISSRAMAEGVKKMLLVFDEWQKSFEDGSP